MNVTKLKIRPLLTQDRYASVYGPDLGFQSIADWGCVQNWHPSYSWTNGIQPTTRDAFHCGTAIR